MASLHTIKPTGASDHPDRVVVPPHVIAQKRQARAQRQKVLAKTIVAQALDEQEATAAP